MLIKNFAIDNYKSFLASGEIALTSGFNVIVGQNNAGKTALVEVLGLGFQNIPHRSMGTSPSARTVLSEPSRVHVSFEIGRDELTSLVKEELQQVHVPVRETGPSSEQAEQLITQLMGQETHLVTATFTPNSIEAASILGIEWPPDQTESIPTLVLTADASGERLVYSGDGHASQSALLPIKLASALRERIYRFDAQRLNRPSCQMRPSPLLDPDGGNLASVLHILHTSNPGRWDRFNRLVSTVLPGITRIGLSVPSEGNVEIHVWTVDPTTERADLAPTLADSGTGIGQVLAILYVIVTSEFPRIIILDEPQTYLHPGAIRKLISILRNEARYEHQYIVSTHSPNIIAAADPETLLLIRKPGAESQVETINREEAGQLQDCLAEVGARLGDVFGADNVLWVEGRTEEACFPKILTGVAHRPLLGTVIVGIVNTGDFESKRSGTIFDVYERLSGGAGLVPPAIGFIFDTEGRSVDDRNDLQRRRPGKVHFLPRRTYENYLLNPEAIAALANSIEEFTAPAGETITATQIEEWLEANRWNAKYIPPEADLPLERWLHDVHGAKLLAAIFTELSEARVEYEKVKYGEWLTDWLIENSPDDLTEVGTLLSDILSADGSITR